MRALDRRVVPRNVRSMRRDTREHETPKRILYLRSQLWLGLAAAARWRTRRVSSAASPPLALKSTSYPPTAFRASTSLHESSNPRCGSTAGSASSKTWPTTWPSRSQRWHAARAFKPELIYQRHTAFNVSGAVLSRVLRRAAGARVQQLGAVERALLGRAATDARRGAGRAHQPARRRPRRRRLAACCATNSSPGACLQSASWSIRTASTRAVPPRRRRHGACASDSASIRRRRRSAFRARSALGTASRRWPRALPLVLEARPTRALAAARRRTAAPLCRPGRQGRTTCGSRQCPGWCRTPRCRAILPRATCWSRRTAAGRRRRVLRLADQAVRVHGHRPGDRRQRARPDRRGADTTSDRRCWSRRTTPRHWRAPSCG